LASVGEALDQPGPNGTPASLQAARRLVARALAESGPASAQTDHGLADALQRACALVLRNIQEAMGDDGRDALLDRAAFKSETLHPVVRQLRDPGTPGISREQLSAAVAADSMAARAGIEALLASLIETLARLIGEDMALHIIARDADGNLDREASRGAQPPDSGGAVS